MVTKEELENVTGNTTLYMIKEFNADGTPVRWRVNGKVKTWKRDITRIRVPVKHGLYDYGYVDENNMHIFTLKEEDAY